MLLAAQHRVAEPLRVALPHVMDVGQGRGAPDGFKLVEVAFFLQGLFDERHPVEVVLERTFIASGNHEDVGDPRTHGLFDHVLDSGFVHDGEHFLRHRLRGGQETGPQSRSRNDCLTYGVSSIHNPRLPMRAGDSPFPSVFSRWSGPGRAWSNVCRSEFQNGEDG
jgi:hypothetical protein